MIPLSYECAYVVPILIWCNILANILCVQTDFHLRLDALHADGLVDLNRFEISVDIHCNQMVSHRYGARCEALAKTLACFKCLRAFIAAVFEM